MKSIKNFGGTLCYCGMENTGFKRNLTMVDSCMPQIIGNMLLCLDYENDIKECVNLLNM